MVTKSIKAMPKGSFLLPIQTGTIVPSTMYDKKVSDAVFRNRINATRMFLARLFGGYTSVTSRGGYVAKSGKHISERTAIVICYAQRKDFMSKKKLWFAWIKKKKAEWKQEAIGVIIENDMGYI